MSGRTALSLCFLVFLLSKTEAAPPAFVGDGGAGPGRGPGTGPGGPRWPAYQSPIQPLDGAQVPNSVLEYYHALGWLRSYANKLETQANRLPEIREPLQQIQSDALFLQQKWVAWPRLHPRQSPYSGNVKADVYFRTLQGAQKQLKGLDKASPKDLIETIKAVAADLHAKAENCRFSADGLGKDLKVTVCTKVDTKEVGGYEVWCAPVMLVKFKDEHIRFPKISSPTIARNFAPGRYAMWLEKDKRKTEPVEQTIGGHGETEFEIDLPIPAELR